MLATLCEKHLIPEEIAMPTGPEESVSTEQALRTVQGELSSSRRWWYRVLLSVVGVWVAALLSLWATEPEPLPLRLHFSLGCMTIVGAGWVGVLIWILHRRNCPSALDRITTAWMATAACSLFLVVSVAIACLRGDMQAALDLGLVGLVCIGVALSMLWRAYSLRSRLQCKLTTLSQSNHTVPAVLLLLITVLHGARAMAQDSALTLQTSTLQSADGKTFEMETGRLHLPVHHADPNGPTLEIAFLRVRGRGSQTTPPTFVLAGGPGDSGIRVVRQMFMAGDRIRSVLPGDVVGIDQRGSGAAKPNLDVPDRYGFSITKPGDPRQYLPMMQKTCQAVARRLQDHGIDLTAFNTQENADDIDTLREQLGYARINLWGTSYGSQLALKILKRHSAHIDRVMLASPVGPDHLWKRPTHIHGCLERIADQHPGLLTNMASVISNLEDGPRFVHVRHPITGKPYSIGISAFDIRLWTWHSLARLETLQQLPTAFDRMANGEFSEQAHWLARFRSTAGVQSAMNHLMDAASGCSRQRHLQIDREAHDDLLGDVANFLDGRLKSIAWDVPDLGDDFRKPVRSTRPVLVLCGEFDAKTPLENAFEILSSLPNGRLVIIRDEGHGFRPREDVLNVVASFFHGQDLPKVQYLGD